MRKQYTGSFVLWISGTSIEWELGFQRTKRFAKKCKNIFVHNLQTFSRNFAFLRENKWSENWEKEAKFRYTTPITYTNIQHLYRTYTDIQHNTTKVLSIFISLSRVVYRNLSRGWACFAISWLVHHPLGHQNPLETIDFTDPGGVEPPP